MDESLTDDGPCIEPFVAAHVEAAVVDALAADVFGHGRRIERVVPRRDRLRQNVVNRKQRFDAEAVEAVGHQL